MKKWFIILMICLLITGCASKNQNYENSSDSFESIKATELNILTPSGAPALALVDLFETSAEHITVVDGADVLQAALVNPNPVYDVIVAPTNLGVKLAQAGKSHYRLAAIITWGNLYVVAESEEALKSEDAVFAAFGEQAVPGLVFESVKDLLELDEVTYYNAVTEAQAALLSGNADAALIAEPAAAATIAKAKENDKTLTVVSDIQALWEDKTGSLGYPQASIFVLETQENKEQIDDFLSMISKSLAHYASADVANDLTEAIDAAGAHTLGVPSAQIVANCYARMGLNYRLASECEKELTDFLSLFGISYDSSISIR